MNNIQGCSTPQNNSEMYIREREGTVGQHDPLEISAGLQHPVAEYSMHASSRESALQERELPISNFSVPFRKSSQNRNTTKQLAERKNHILQQLSLHNQQRELMLPSEDESQHLSAKYQSLSQVDIRHMNGPGRLTHESPKTATEHWKNGGGLHNSQNKSFYTDADFLHMSELIKHPPNNKSPAANVSTVF